VGDDGRVSARILVVDNYDSFVFNIVQYLAQLGAEVDVRRNDEVVPDEGRAYDGVLLSPGPGTPADAGVCLAMVHELAGVVPIFGVCLGHQAIGVACGGTVDRTGPVHGKASRVFHEGDGILEGVSNPFEAGRYHSLVVLSDDLPDELELTGWTEDGLVMATQHRELPRFGVQFHPESILTPEGPRIVANFLRLTERQGAGQSGP
jgi:para-aminobenzoate synthetase component 2